VPVRTTALSPRSPAPARPGEPVSGRPCLPMLDDHPHHRRRRIRPSRRLARTRSSNQSSGLNRTTRRRHRARTAGSSRPTARSGQSPSHRSPGDRSCRSPARSGVATAPTELDAAPERRRSSRPTPVRARPASRPTADEERRGPGPWGLAVRPLAGRTTILLDRSVPDRTGPSRADAVSSSLRAEKACRTCRRRRHAPRKEPSVERSTTAPEPRRWIGRCAERSPRSRAPTRGSHGRESPRAARDRRRRGRSRWSVLPVRASCGRSDRCARYPPGRCDLRRSSASRARAPGVRSNPRIHRARCRRARCRRDLP
jgi:hypothetical protein